MSLLDKFRGMPQPLSPPKLVGRSRAAAAAALQRSAPATQPRNGRLSNALKDFLWHLEGRERGNLLDLGTVSQNTLNFFIERRFKVYTEDLLRSWKDFLRVEEERLRTLPPGQDPDEGQAGTLAERFLGTSLQYTDETFDAVLAWDIFDYLDSDMVARVVGKLASLLKESGIVLAIFHSRKPDAFHRYRVLDTQNLELVSAPSLFPVQRIYQNRELQNLFSAFRSSKTFVGRDQLREGLFIR